MFKIVENTNGTTSIFCNQSGQLVCTVHSRKSSLVGVSRPIQKAEAATNKNPSISLRALYANPGKHDGYESHFAESDYDTVSCVSYNSSDSEDPPDDCIDQISFLQSFNLIRTSEICKKPITELKSTFPRRKISRVKGSSLVKRIHVQKQENIFENIKLFDEVELCSPLGHLALDSSQRYLDEREVSTAIKKYEKYCQFSVLSVHPNTIHLPQLRCRDNLKYPITFRPTKYFKSYWSHSYTFGHRQRDNHYRTLITGLSERSRKLKRLCRKMQVTLCRLSKCDLRFHTAQLNNTSQSVQQKRTIADEKAPTSIKGVSFRNLDQTKDFKPLSSHNDSNFCCSSNKRRECVVKMENVLKSLVLIENKVYVRDTNIIVPEHYILELAIKKPPNILRMKRVNCVKNNSRTVEWIRLHNTSLSEQSQTIKENALPSLEEIQNNLPHLTKGDSKMIPELIQQIQLQDYKSKQPFSGRKQRFACTLPFCQNTSEKRKMKQDPDYTLYGEGASVLIHSRKRYQLSGVDFIPERNSRTNTINGNTETYSHQQSPNVGNNGCQCKTLRTVAENSPQKVEILRKLLSNNSAMERIPLQQKCQMLNEANHPITESVPNTCYGSQQNASTNVFTLKNSVNSNMKTMGTDKSEMTVAPFWPSWFKPTLCDINMSSVKRNGLKLTPSEQEITEDIFSDKFHSLDTSVESGNNTDILPSLTLQTDNDKPKTFTSSYIFKCHGCGFKASFESSRETLHNANHHMTSYHSVKEPNTFLAHTSVIHDDHVEIITEGFPSYKPTDFSEL